MAKTWILTYKDGPDGKWKEVMACDSVEELYKHFPRLGAQPKDRIMGLSCNGDPDTFVASTPEKVWARVAKLYACAHEAKRLCKVTL